MIGRTVFQYRIVALLGRGAMGMVYRAVDGKSGRTVAVKLLAPEWSGNETVIRCFAREVQIACSLRHPNICRIYGLRTTGEGTPAIVMEHYEGETLKARIERGPLPTSEALDVARQAAWGLSWIHRQGIVHRDIKPTNIFITRKGVIKVLDFGLAQCLSETTHPEETRRLTGTLAYMSPEQTQGTGTDARTDVWSLGVIMYEMIAGEHPFLRDRVDQLVDSIRNAEPAPVGERNRRVPPALEKLIRKSMSKDRSGRFANAAELLAEIEGLSRRGSERRRASSRFRSSASYRRPVAGPFP